ncbi:MAG TPA: hypothetical protein VHY09_14140 [Candidatus Methylacidiphilales bacterium]|nr:hypothetical protein [Candidatus Methylacidiphilales bacterium]
MANTRKLIAQFVGVFVIGALAGGLVSYSLSDTSLTMAMSHWNNADALEARINARYISDYHLTPDEMEKIKPLTKQLAQDLYKIRHQFGVDVIDTLNRDHAAIAAQLTPEHRSVYEAKMTDRTDKLSAALMGDQSSPAQGQK